MSYWTISSSRLSVLGNVSSRCNNEQFWMMFITVILNQTEKINRILILFRKFSFITSFATSNTHQCVVVDLNLQITVLMSTVYDEYCLWWVYVLSMMSIEYCLWWVYVLSMMSTVYWYRRILYSWFSSNSEAEASELLENHEQFCGLFLLSVFIILVSEDITTYSQIMYCIGLFTEKRVKKKG